MDATAIVGTLMLNRKYETDSSSSSAEKWEQALKLTGKRKLRPRILNYVDIVNSFMDNEFKIHFRMSKTTFEYLLEILRADLVKKEKGCPTIPSHQQLMIAVWKMATMDSYRSVCDRFNVGKAARLRTVRMVTRALFNNASRFIEWPTGDPAVRVMRGFEEGGGFSKTIGAIDGTHIRIDAPQENPAYYINRKGFHSIQLQLVCDHKTLITHCHTGHPGSVHDQRGFRQSEVADYLNDEDKFLADSHILGDAAYELHQHLLTSYRDNGHLTERQNNYNYRHSSARMRPMQRVYLMAEYIIARCVIHNICTLLGDEITVITLPATSQNLVINGAGQNAGVQKRNLIMDTLQ